MNKANILRKTLFLAGIFSITLNGSNTPDHAPATQAHQTINAIAKKPITIWIHGTRGNTFLPLGISRYAYQVEELMSGGPLGLHLASAIDKKYYHHTIARTLSDADKNQFPFENFYIFNWSGKLDVFARVKSARNLYLSLLKKIIIPYREQHGVDPNITIFTHSHGGNVALKLADLADIAHEKISINRLVLLACPVQKHTAHCIESDIFKNIYSLHSHHDTVQILDPQKLHPLKNVHKEMWQQKSLKPLYLAFKKCGECPLFSERHFAQSEKLKQVNIKWKHKAPWTPQDMKPFGSFIPKIKSWLEPLDKKNRGLLHIEFLTHTFIKQLPDILQKIERGHTKPTLNSPDILIEL